ncbi:MAG: Stk1 family PASTA domain-containing Ser/Thr kinase [Clostridia bacterium]|nr:Stk1 family PASTA domain-containing Ser/Thr kinase [Clostridia bacterium]
MDNYTGKRLDGRYEIQEVVGVGGMAVVYKAYDNIDDRIVAVKILKDEFLANEEFRRRFKNESKAISLLSHPNIVKVYNVNYGDRLQYIVMEYVEGITLKEYIEQQGKLGIKETIHFTMQILRALQHAHDKGIIHRDIKPQNILLLSNGNIKVTDFGIARFSYSDTKTMTDSAIGSVHYISPEQARGNSIDERTDIYSVGVVMYEMLTGKLPFVSDNSVSVALMQLQTDAKSIREINPNIPVGLEQIVKRAMEKDAKQRYQTASEMLLDIEEFKRNPNIRFQQDFFIDSSPTKYAEKVPPEVKKVKPIPEAVENEDDEEEEKKGGRAGFIIAGILMGLAVVGLVVFGALWFFTDMFKKEVVVVPDFVGKNYEEEIKNNNEYINYNFEIITQASGMYSDGTVIDQDPQAGRNLDSSNSTITLTIVDNAVPTVIPDVSGMDWEKAETILKGKGFTVNKLPTMSAIYEFGKVIKTEPTAGTEAISGSLVTIYYASDEDFIDVPSVVGWDVDTARSLLESVNLALDENYEEVNSDEPAGQIISQNPAEGDRVLPGQRITVTVSNGVPDLVKANLKIILPMSNQTQTFEVFVNNESKIKKDLIMDGSEYSFSVEGTEANSTIKVYIAGSEYYSCTADFTTNPAKITNEHSLFGGSSSLNKPLPNLVGMTLEAASSTLNSSGFKNVEVRYSPVTDASQDGIVIAQAPEPTGMRTSLGGLIQTPETIPVATAVIITVGQLEGVAG